MVFNREINRKYHLILRQTVKFVIHESSCKQFYKAEKVFKQSTTSKLHDVNMLTISQTDSFNQKYSAKVYRTITINAYATTL